MGRLPHRSRRENARRIGVVFGQRSQLWWDLPVIDSFDLHRYVYNIPADRYRSNLAECEELLRMRDFIDFPVRQLSLGQRMRAELALALLHDPDILFLDEPTIGLDVTAKDRIREFLKMINRERRVTIILASHDLKDIEEICPRILVINRGTIVYDGEVTALKEKLGTQSTIVVDFAHVGSHAGGDCAAGPVGGIIPVPDRAAPKDGAGVGGKLASRRVRQDEVGFQAAPGRQIP